MPKLYEYMGLIIFFYSNEHEPVHVHGRHQSCENKIEITLEDGLVTQITLKPVKGKKELPPKQQKDFEHLVSTLSAEIVQNWIDYFVYNKKIISKKIEGKLK